MSKKTTGHVAKIIEQEVGFFNGWHVDEHTEQECYTKAAKRINRYLRRKHIQEFGPTSHVPEPNHQHPDLLTNHGE